jgi:hypothetical protein
MSAHFYSSFGLSSFSTSNIGDAAEGYFVHLKFLDFIQSLHQGLCAAPRRSLLFLGLFVHFMSVRPFFKRSLCTVQCSNRQTPCILTFLPAPIAHCLSLVLLQEKQEILVEKATRNKRKAITTVKGMELFGMPSFPPFIGAFLRISYGLL